MSEILLRKLLLGLPNADDTECAIRLLKTAALEVMIVVTLNQEDPKTVSELITKILYEIETVRFVVISNSETSIDSSKYAFELKELQPIDRARMFYDLTKTSFEGQLINLYD